MDADIFDQFIDQLGRYVRERLIPAEKDILESDVIPDAIVDEMRELGLFGLTTPEEYGGAAMTIAQYIRTIRTLSYAAPCYRSIVSINIGMVCSALKNGGTEEQKAEWLPRLAAGEIASFGLTEPGSGSDSAAMQTSAVKSGNGWVLNGTKRYITNAPFAKVALIMARTNKEALPKNAHVSAFIVPLDTPGISVGSPDKKMGQAGAHIADIIMEDVKLPADALLGGEEGRGFALAMKSLDNGRLSVGAAATGYARRALDSALRYANERKAFGEPIANFQLIQQMLADSEIEIYAAECMLEDAARRADAGENILRKAAAAKVFATEMCGRVVDRVVQIYGGAGYLAEYDAERFFRDARIYRIYEGTTQILQLQIAKHMLREWAAQA
ncbi:MAG TPA: acyl-CoA dehydrogenase family protein [Sphingorhabdus lacus]|uniref:Acyl-CoA dehydrogenase n=1 Tax=Sphingorhabdus lacus TaxID=392610 RepID=A0A6I6LCG6_9SPHN|nr:acyl-CoA dehydrogenase family protein [Sphingorhabdus lacus]QGY82178.1 acyl-CoA dehydrogenase [Sphingorhabdus lacus]HNW17434.1 acyl-CoA dehydrogenase family protein [Sphingorhabdus lacus]HPV68182.1 acyl-CoA dehydrogenase family protein [Sphingorhabdus lacus]